MNLDQRLTNVSVIGAAGKMGSGIALLMAHEMFLQKIKPENSDNTYRLHLIDTDEKGLDGLMQYIKSQSVKKAEKSTIMLRDVYAERQDLVENSEIIQQYVDEIMSMMRPGSDINNVRDSHLVFEAIIENIEIKISLFKKLNELCKQGTFFFSNTSSIPIHLLNNGAELGGRIIGFHFYNPPVVQKLAELIPARDTLPELKALSVEIGNRLRKKIYLSADVAGFIGNGHFLRDALHAISEVRRLQKELTPAGAIFLINKVSQDLLLRPMGIFQLMDYVGVDVMYFISRIMDTYIECEDLRDDLIDAMYENKILGGQHSDGSQKNGFFKYEKSRPIGIYDVEKQEYVMFEQNGWSDKLTEKLGKYPASWLPWKKLLMNSKRHDHLKSYFNELKKLNTLGAEIARAYFESSRKIGHYLVDKSIAESADDVNGVLMNGFYHLYGPINEYM